MHQIRVGTCGWSYPDWSGVFYPEGLPSGEYLSFCAERCLRKHRATWVIVDQAWMPPPVSLVEKLDLVTGPFAYMRLLGEREEVDKLTNRLDHIVIDRTGQIAADARVAKLLSERVEVLVFINTHFAGYSPETIRQFLKELGASPEQCSPTDF
jgi:uncharacterized protein YecE (DUF72 family)